MKTSIIILISIGLLFIFFPVLPGILLGIFFIFLALLAIAFTKNKKGADFKNEKDFVQFGKYKIFKNNKK